MAPAMSSVSGKSSSVTCAAAWRIRTSRVMRSAPGSLRSTLGAPMLEARERMDAFGDALRIERGDRVVVDQHVLPSRLVLELRHLGDELPVVRQERALRRERAGDERLANEYLARGLRVDGAERNAPPRDERQAVELHAFARDHFAAAFVPARLEVVARHAVPGDRFDPFGLDFRRAPREEPRRFDELGGQHPFRPLLRKARPRMQEEPDSARAGVAFVLAVQRSDVADEAREQRLVNRLVFRMSIGRGKRPASTSSPARRSRSRVARARRAIRAAEGRRRNAPGTRRRACGA